MTTLIEELVAEIAELPPLETLTPREEVTLLLERIVAKYGRDYVYTRVTPVGAKDVGCYYADITEVVYRPDGLNETRVTKTYEPSCILGHLLHVKEPSLLARVVELDSEFTGEQYNQWGWTVLGKEDRGFVPEAWAADESLMECLSNLQCVQDDGTPWGEALDAFKAELAACPA